MIDYANRDFKLKTICDPLSDVYINFNTNSYFVFGLKMHEARPHVSVSACVMEFNKLRKRLLSVQNIFSKSNIRMSLHEADCDDEGCGSRCGTIRIGLRKDVRLDPDFARSIVMTIIQASENKLKMPRNFKIKHELAESKFNKVVTKEK